MPPKSRHLPARTSWRNGSQAGFTAPGTAGCSVSTRERRRRSSPSGGPSARPRGLDAAAQHEVAVEGGRARLPPRFCRTAIRAASASRSAHDSPPTDVGVAAQGYFVLESPRTSGAEASCCCRYASQKTCCPDDDRAAPPARAPQLGTAADVDTVSTGSFGFSTHNELPSRHARRRRCIEVGVGRPRVPGDPRGFVKTRRPRGRGGTSRPYASAGDESLGSPHRARRCRIAIQSAALPAFANAPAACLRASSSATPGLAPARRSGWRCGVSVAAVVSPSLRPHERGSRPRFAGRPPPPCRRAGLLPRGGTVARSRTRRGGNSWASLPPGSELLRAPPKPAPGPSSAGRSATRGNESTSGAGQHARRWPARRAPAPEARVELGRRARDPARPGGRSSQRAGLMISLSPAGPAPTRSEGAGP